ncbi:MAG: VWA domain-containing protein [Paracoccaceae bacterium]
MTPETQAIRDRLRCSVRKIDDIFEDAFNEAQTVLSPSGIDAWLTGVDRVCALGRGTELPLIFLDEIPEIVRHSDEAIISEIADVTAYLSEFAVRGSYAPFLSSLPSIARRLNSASLLRGWLKMVREMVTGAKEGTTPFLERAPYIFSQLSCEGVNSWVNYGKRVYKDHPHRLPDYFGLKSADAQAMLVKERSGTLFMDHERQLRMFERAFWNLETEFRPYSMAFDTARKPRPHISTLGLHIPDVYEDLGDVSGIDRYRAMIAHMMAHKVWSKPYLADNFSAFQHISIEVFEDARVEYLAIQKFPGLRQLWLKMHPAPHPGRCPDGWSCIRHDLAILSFALLNPDHRYTNPSVLTFVEKFKARIETNPYDTDMAKNLGVEWLKDNFVHEFRQPKVWFEDTEVSYRDDNRYLWIFLEEAEEADDFTSDHGAQSRANDEDDEGLLPPQHYPEWDSNVQNYRPDWATVYEAIQPAGNASEIDSLLDKHKMLSRQLRQIVDLLKPQQRKRVRYQEEGDELDLDTAIRAAIDHRIGSTPDTRIHQNHVKDGRDISVLLLLDLSKSIGKVPKGVEHTILQLSQEAVALMAEAVEGLGDPFAIAGFSSNTRHEVRYTHLKGFSEAWGHDPKARLAAIKAGDSTRMGAALRHAGRYLENRKEEKRLLLLLTDGEPHDIDEQDPKYLQDDTHVAVKELESKGITTYCITLDPDADDYVADVFGRNNYTVIDKVERLPEKLPRLFMSLTR